MALRATPSGTGAIGMTNGQEVRVQTWGPDGGNPTPRVTRALTRSTGPRAEVMRIGTHAELPVRGSLVEVIGAWPFRAKAKRRKAARMGKLTRSSEARFPLVSAGCSGDGMDMKSVGLTRGGLLGSALAVGRTTQEGTPIAQQIKDRCAVPEGGRKAVPTVGHLPAWRESIGGAGGGRKRNDLVVQGRKLREGNTTDAAHALLLCYQGAYCRRATSSPAESPRPSTTRCPASRHVPNAGQIERSSA